MGPYTVTFVNVDDSATSYTVDAGVVLTPPAGVNTDTRTFTGWPTIEPASADVTYTALYTVDVGPADVTWDGDAGDGLWLTAANWSGDAAPTSGQTVAITNGDTVDMPANDWGLPTGITVNVAGGSQITNSASAARLYGDMTFNFLAGSGMGGVYIDLGDGILNFEDGATFTPGSIQQRGTTTYGITLSATGFTTLTPGGLVDGNGEDWSDVTFNLDVSKYDASNGLTVELIDFASHAGNYDGSFNPTVNVEAGDSGLSGTLSFDTASSKVIFTFDSAPTTYEITFINVDDSQVVQTVNAGVVATPPAGVNTATRTFTGWPTVAAASADATYTALYDEAATYTITFINVDDTQVVQTVNAGVVATPPAGVNTATRTFTGWPTVAAASADATYTALYDEAATYTITFINVDDTQTTQTVGENQVATPPTGVSTAARTFTGWPTIDPATEDATYTALYDTIDPTVVDIYIVAGQSNAYGYGLVSDLPAGENTQDALFYTSWHDTANDAESTQHFSGLEAQTVAGSSRGDPGSSTLGGSSHFGPEMGFVARANEISLSSNPMAIVKYAVGGTALTQNVAVSDWDLTATAPGDGDCWRGFQAALADAVAKLEAQNYTPNFKGLVWWQGESGTSATDLNAFIAAVRSLLGNTYGVANSSEFPFVITGHDNRWGTDLESGVAAIDPYVGFVNSNDYGQVYKGGSTDFNTHPGSAERDFSTDETGNGLNDMWDIGLAYADQMALIVDGSGPVSGPYTITFVNVDDSATTYTVDAGVVLTPPAGVNTDTRTFTAWPTIAPASADVTYTALYTVDVGTADVTWDGDAGDGLWLTAANWSGDAAPTSGQTVAITNGDTVDMPANDWSLPTGITVNVAGGSQITNSASAARLYGDMTFNFLAGSGMGGVYIDLGDGILNFEDGATFTPGTIQQRNTTTYGITLSGTGFTTLTPGALVDGNGEDWSDVTFNLDVSKYDASNGLTVELIDFASHSGNYDGSFNPTVNVEAGDSGLSGTLSFDTASSKVIFTFDSAPTTYEITFINADDSQAVQTVNANVVATPPVVWTPTRVPSPAGRRWLRRLPMRPIPRSMTKPYRPMRSPSLMSMKRLQAIPWNKVSC